MRRFPLVSLMLAGLLGLASPAAAGNATPAEAQALLDKAVKLVQTDGDAKALAAFNNPKGGFVDRELYVFCYGPGGKITAHRDPKMVGIEVATVKDADGNEIGKQMVELGAKGQGSLEYKSANPVTNKIENKVSSSSWPVLRPAPGSAGGRSQATDRRRQRRIVRGVS